MIKFIKKFSLTDDETKRACAIIQIIEDENVIVNTSLQTFEIYSSKKVAEKNKVPYNIQIGMDVELFLGEHHIIFIVGNEPNYDINKLNKCKSISEIVEISESLNHMIYMI